jgi:dipeptidase
MCDTLVRLTDVGVLFAKNSDRDPNEAQIIEWHPGAEHPPGAELRCTWLTIPQVPRTRPVLISRPWWMWGAEIGTNDAGVTIGNEAVFTNGSNGDPALLGMDLLRLALERAGSVTEAAEVIVSLLERYGQGGNCSYERRFTYDNSFLIADPNGALVLETADRSWASETVTGPGRSISNCLTIEPFAAAHADRLKERVANAAARRHRTESLCRTAGGPGDMMGILRSHGPAAQPRYSWLNGSMTPCMHAGGVLVNSQTTASWVAHLRDRPLHWVTGTSAPCTALFIPVRVDQPTDLGPLPTNRVDSGGSLWWSHERLHRLALRDPSRLLPRILPERDLLEQEFLAAPPDTATALERGAMWRRRSVEELESLNPDDRRPLVARGRWAAWGRRAGLFVRPT